MRWSSLVPGGWWQDLALDVLALLWPTACVGCGLADRELCVGCAYELSEVNIQVTAQNMLRTSCYAAGPYEGIARSALIAYKHRGAFGLVRRLGQRLAVPLQMACAEATRDPPIIITIPSRSRRVRERGYRHVDELVKAALRAEPILAELMPALRPLRGRTGQVGLEAEAREVNARRIAVRKLWADDLQGREVILVDDIVTTGATVRAAAEALEAVGAHIIAVVALCVTVRRDTQEN